MLYVHNFAAHKIHLKYHTYSLLSAEKQSPGYLAKDVHQCGEEIDKINRELIPLHRKIDDTKAKYNSNCKDMNGIEDVFKANIMLKLNNDEKLQRIRSARDKLLELRTKIKQRKLELANYKKK